LKEHLRYLKTFLDVNILFVRNRNYDVSKGMKIVAYKIIFDESNS